MLNQINSLIIKKTAIVPNKIANTGNSTMKKISKKINNATTPKTGKAKQAIIKIAKIAAIALNPFYTLRGTVAFSFQRDCGVG